MVMDPTLPRISVRDLMMQAFLTGWELSDKTVSQDEYLQSSIQVIEMLQVEPENLYAEEGLGLPDGEEDDGDDDDQREREIDVKVVRQRRRGGFRQGDKAHPLAIIEPDVEAARDVGVLHAPGAVHSARAESIAHSHAAAHAGRTDFTLAAEALGDCARNLPARNVRRDLVLVDWRDLEVVGLQRCNDRCAFCRFGRFEDTY